MYTCSDAGSFCGSVEHQVTSSARGSYCLSLQFFHPLQQKVDAASPREQRCGLGFLQRRTVAVWHLPPST
jgi:hypothetical protein